MADRLFSALLKYWRARRGLTQLDLALAADVSARHLSFLESGRASPSEAMVLRLLAALDVPLRDQNDVLRAARFAPRYAEPSLNQLAPAIQQAIDRMLAQQEPYPLTLLDSGYTVVRANRAAGAVFSRFVADPAFLAQPVNLFALVFDPRGARPFIHDWAQVARRMVARLHREVLQRPDAAALASLLDQVLAHPDVPRAWRQPDFSRTSEPTLSLVLERDGLRLGFFTVLTAFSWPQQITLDELRLESYFPLDEATQRACEQLAARCSIAQPLPPEAL